MPKFKHYDYNQTCMVAINYEEQLKPGTFEHAIHYLIANKLDLSIFTPHYQNDNNGRPAYDPAILLKIILFAYAVRHRFVSLARWGAFITIFGIVLNRINTALITFNWQLYQEIPHIFELIITLTIFCIYIVVYRFILYRLPILFTWKGQEEEVLASETAKAAPARTTVSPAGAMYRNID